MSKIKSNGIIYSTTSLRIEDDIKQRAKKLNINFSRIFHDALVAEIKRVEKK